MTQDQINAALTQCFITINNLQDRLSGMAAENSELKAQLKAKDTEIEKPAKSNVTKIKKEEKAE